MKYLLSLIFLFLTACKSTDSKNFIHYTNGAESLNAYQLNPLLKCEKKPEIARLDKDFENRVFLIEGELCK